MSDDWKKLEQKSTADDMWKPADGDVLVGKLTGKRHDVGQYKSTLYTIETDGGVKKVWGSAGLDMSMGQVAEGDTVRIEFQGLKENPRNGRKFKAFEVSVKPKEVETNIDDIEF